VIRKLGPRTAISFSKPKGADDYTVQANVNVDPDPFGGGHWFDVDTRVPGDYDALRVTDEAYNNRGEFRGRHSVVITRDYSGWLIEDEKADHWDVEYKIVSTAEEAKRDKRDAVARWVFAWLIFAGIFAVGARAVEVTGQLVLIGAGAFGIGGFVGGYFARPRRLPGFRVFDPEREKKRKKHEQSGELV
jgi:hypothetical protein